MKKRILAMVLSMAMVFTMLPAASAKAEDGVTPASMERIVSAGDAPVENLARQATVEVGHVNTPAANINDGTLAGGDPATSWNCWGAAADKYPMPVTLTWSEAKTLSSMRVMWYAYHDGGVVFPSSAKLQYKDEAGNWQTIQKAVGVEHGEADGVNGVWNVVNFDSPISATGLKMLVYRGEVTGAAGVGISEWEVFADSFKEKISEAKVIGATELAVGQTVEYVGSVAPQSLSDAASYEWSVAFGSESLIAIQGAANAKNVSVKALAAGEAKLHLKVTEDGIVKETDFTINTMSEQDVLNFDVNLLQTPEKVNADFTLPTISKNGYAITWQSDNEAIVMNNGVGTVIKDDNRLKVKLSATVIGKDEQESGKRTATKDFIIVVPSKVYLASEATVTGSYNGPSDWQSLSKINDGDDTSAWNGWGDNTEYAQTNQGAWILYTFTDKVELTGSIIRFMSDDSGVAVPNKVEFQYHDANDDTVEFKPVTADGDWVYETEKDNEYFYKDKIITDKVKLLITNGTTTKGAVVPAFIYEWGLIGKKYVMPNLTPLNNLISQAEEIDTTGKPEAQVTALTEALTAAQAVAADKNPTQTQVDKAYIDLRDAIVALGGTIQIDRTELEAAITAADALVAEKDKYTPASWKRVSDALTAAKELQSSETADQIAVDEAAAALNHAVTSLVEKADKTALEAAIAKAEGLKANQAQYPGANWESLDTALVAATAARNNENADQAAVDTALGNLNTEIARVESYKEEDPTKPSIDKEDLIAAITKAQGLKENEEDYLEDADWAALDTALTAAIAARDDEDADQAAVNAALADLNTAIGNIEAKKKPGTDPTNPDKTALKTAITNAESLKAEKDIYTETSWQKVEDALTAAIEVRDNENAEKEAIDEAAKNLTDAIAALEKKSSGGNVLQTSFTELTKAVDAVKNYKQADYTDASWKSFDTALKSAQAVLANKSATQEQVDKATADLNNAAKALVKLKVVSTKKVTLGVGESYSVKGKDCTYAISDNSKATVSNKGVVKAKKTGSVVVKAVNINGNVTQYNITIKKAPKKISKVTFNKKAIKKNKVTLKKGKKGTLRVTLPKGTASKITYTSSNKKIATVDSKGVVKAKKKKGTTTITIKTFNKKTKKIKVTVK